MAFLKKRWCLLSSLRAAKKGRNQTRIRVIRSMGQKKSSSKKRISSLLSRTARSDQKNAKGNYHLSSRKRTQNPPLFAMNGNSGQWVKKPAPFAPSRQKVLGFRHRSPLLLKMDHARSAFKRFFHHTAFAK